MSSFLVDPRSLIEVRDKLGRLHDQLLGMHTVVGGYQGVLGGAGLEAELEHFCGRWHLGIVELGGQIADMMRRLTEAAAAYLRIEDETKKAASTGGAPVTGRRGGGVGAGGARRHHPHHGHGGSPAGGSGTTIVGGATDPGHRGASGHGGQVVSVSSGLLTGGQERFVARLATLTGLAPRVIGAWALAEESSVYAQRRQSAEDNNWLNIGYFDSGAGAIAFNRAFRNPESAADKTAESLEGKWGGASPSIHAILHSAGESPERQMSAIADSDWASSHDGGGAHPRGTYADLGGMTLRHN